MSRYDPSLPSIGLVRGHGGLSVPDGGVVHGVSMRKAATARTGGAVFRLRKWI